MNTYGELKIVENLNDSLIYINDTINIYYDEYVGFADAYLRLFEAKLKSDNEIDVQAYSKLVELDSKLGTKAAEQLFMCIYYAPRLNLVKV